MNCQTPGCDTDALHEYRHSDNKIYHVCQEHFNALMLLKAKKYLLEQENERRK